MPRPKRTPLDRYPLQVLELRSSVRTTRASPLQDGMVESNASQSSALQCYVYIVECTCVAVEPNEVDALVEMMRAYYAFDGLAFDEPKARHAVGRLLSDPSCGRAFFIRVGDAIAGYTVLVLGYSIEFHGRDAFVDEIFLREEYRGQGLGPRVLAFLEQVCSSLDVRALHLEVERHNVAAQRVYRRVGFVDHDRYLMTKRIEGNDQ